MNQIAFVFLGQTKCSLDRVRKVIARERKNRDMTF